MSGSILPICAYCLILNAFPKKLTVHHEARRREIFQASRKAQFSVLHIIFCWGEGLITGGLPGSSIIVLHGYSKDAVISNVLRQLKERPSSHRTVGGHWSIFQLPIKSVREIERLSLVEVLNAQKHRTSASVETDKFKPLTRSVLGFDSVTIDQSL